MLSNLEKWENRRKLEKKHGGLEKYGHPKGLISSLHIILLNISIDGLPAKLLKAQ
jgi:hypothetical protein